MDSTVFCHQDEGREWGLNRLCFLVLFQHYLLPINLAAPNMAQAAALASSISPYFQAEVALNSYIKVTESQCMGHLFVLKEKKKSVLVRTSSSNENCLKTINWWFHFSILICWQQNYKLVRKKEWIKRNYKENIIYCPMSVFKRQEDWVKFQCPQKVTTYAATITTQNF